MPLRITVHDLAAWRERGDPHALLDVRERSEFHARQIPGATPLSRGLLELRAPALLPVKDVPLAVLCQDGRRSGPAAETLERMGYRRVMEVAGGMEAWEAAGLPIQEGIGVPGKEYGEKVAVIERIPQITPEELAERRGRGEKPVIMDSRTVEEYRRGHLPGAYSVPGSELPAAAADLIQDPATTVIVNCAGRTRSILGAHILLRMGLPNPVYAFRNGTMAWEMAGFALERGDGRPRPPTSEKAGRTAEQFADRVARDEDLPVMTVEELTELRASGDLHYLIDVRLAEEYEGGHIPGSLSCPGGQLALESENLVAVKSAPVVMACDGRWRAILAASLYRNMGFPRVYVLDGGTRAWRDAGLPLEVGAPRLEVFGLQDARRQASWVAARDLAESLGQREPPAVVDVRGAGDYALGHIPGSRWVARGLLELRVAEELPDPSIQIVAVCDDGVLSTLAAATLKSLGCETRGLEGGLEAWRREGLPLEEGLQGARATLEEAKRDIETHRRTGILSRNRTDMERYLSWEEKLGHRYSRA